MFKPYFRLYFPRKAKQDKTKETLYHRRATSAPALLDSLPSVCSVTLGTVSAVRRGFRSFGFRS
jgi:hypothetical protein